VYIILYASLSLSLSLSARIMPKPSRRRLRLRFMAMPVVKRRFIDCIRYFVIVEAKIQIFFE
jgi:hypothetical protein